MAKQHHLENVACAPALTRAAAAVAERLKPTPAPDVSVPILIVDAYWQDLAHGAYPGAWHRMAALTCAEVYDGQAVEAASTTHAYHGAILKATQGTKYLSTALRWFAPNYQAAREAGGDRLGDDWFVGAYHYLMFGQDGVKQADYYLDTVDKAGGLNRPGAILPIVDIEFGGEGAANRQIGRAQVIDCASDFAARCLFRTGRAPILYGGSALSSLRIKDHLGCSWLWPAAYSDRLKRSEATSIGWTLDEVIMWQYTDGTAGRAVTTKGTRLPIGIPPTKAGRARGDRVLDLDCSIVVRPGGIAGARRALLGTYDI